MALGVWKTQAANEIKKWIVHPSYSGGPKYYNDIAIIELKEPAKINKRVNTACLPFVEPNDESTVLISGWGKTKHGYGRPSNILQKVSVNIISRKRCKDMYAKPLPSGQTGEITDVMICAGREGKDSCQGDSGGMKLHSYEIYHLLKMNNDTYLIISYTFQKRSNGEQKHQNW